MHYWYLAIAPQNGKTRGLAYLIKVSSIKNAPSGFFKPVDPRIIIPIAAIETLEQGKLPKKVDIER